MKKFLLAIICLIIGGMAFAQAPQKMSYQAVIRDNSGNIVANQQISMRISILKKTELTELTDLSSAEYPIAGRTRAFGDDVTYTNMPTPTYNQEIYIETHTVSTNTNGLVSIEIGTGNVSMGNFSSIDWSEGTYFIKTDVDLNGGTRFKTIGTSQLISVPYAMYAQKAGSAVTETDPQFNAWDKDYNDLTNRPEIPVVPTNVSAFENDANYLTSYTETDPQFMVNHNGLLTEKRMIPHRMVYGYYPEVVTSVGKERDVLRNLADSYLYRDVLSFGPSIVTRQVKVEEVGTIYEIPDTIKVIINV